eukprot:TRINITY_DN110466_c0_g1_i1.p1 TRINITY_DN110466_c0_g1~~TRINITY_DN110466_c0_g1_i1.p1  ORF type:complete len:225 (+),score=26.46 TRINITY_DN110466_c0_g1_i1:204-878(+)
MTNGNGEVRMNREEFQAVLLRFAEVPYGLGMVPMRMKFQCSLPPDCYQKQHPNYLMGEYYPCHQCKVVTIPTGESYELSTDLEMEMCPSCSGCGYVMDDMCPSCLGLCVLTPLPEDSTEICEVCEKTGLLQDKLCPLRDGVAPCEPARRQRGPLIQVSEDYQKIHKCLEKITNYVNTHEPKLHPDLKHAMAQICDSKLEGMEEVLKMLESFLVEDRLQVVVEFS